MITLGFRATYLWTTPNTTVFWGVVKALEDQLSSVRKNYDTITERITWSGKITSNIHSTSKVWKITCFVRFVCSLTNHPIHEKTFPEPQRDLVHRRQAPKWQYLRSLAQRGWGEEPHRSKLNLPSRSRYKIMAMWLIDHYLQNDGNDCLMAIYLANNPDVYCLTYKMMAMISSNCSSWSPKRP